MHNVVQPWDLAWAFRIRREYWRLPRDVEFFAGVFGVSLDSAQRRDITALAFAIECADRYFDALPAQTQRIALKNAILRRLQGDVAGEGMLPPELSWRLIPLQEIIERGRIVKPFCRLVKCIFANSETMRQTRCARDYVRLARREGRWMTKLLLLVADQPRSSAFGQFMLQLSDPANLVDKLRDARLDYLRGEIALRPGAGFYLKLLTGIGIGVGQLAVRHSFKRGITGWGIRALRSEWSGRGASVGLS